MLAGRKLLLADDSATIQKVIDLTFADEGVRVMAVSSGQEALDRILEFAPDIVLADVFMPSPNGYEVCEYVKTNEQLKHIPVVLLVGSFEPFDEAEARRVGADDILTKPFSSIRRLIDRVGALVGSPPAEKTLAKEGPTAELPRAEEVVEEARLNAKELEVTTPDTMPLPGSTLVDTLPRVEQPVVASASDVTPSARLEAALTESQRAEIESSWSAGTSEHEGRMEPGTTETKSETESADVLLDLGDIEPAHAAASDDEFVLDLDDVSAGETPAPLYEAAATYESSRFDAEAAPMRAFVEPQVTEASTAYDSTPYESTAHESTYRHDARSPFAETQDVPYKVTEIEPVETAAVPPELTPDPVPVFGETEFPIADSGRTHGDSGPVSQPASSAGDRAFSTDQLSPEMIDAIARRAVELMSDKVIREIAWEVVPDLAELLIKRQLEEKQAK